jgi:hypothetical protein
MKKVFLALIALFFVGLASAFAQTASDTIAVEKNKFYYHGLQIESMRQIKSLVANDELALKEVKKSAVTNGFSYVFSYLGGFAIGWEVVDLIRGNLNPYVLAGGVGLAAVGIGLSYLANSQLKKGVAIYNANLGATSYGGSIQLDFGLVPGGVGLTLSF